MINIAPDMIRDMLGLVIEQCVQGGDGGGVVYNAINNTISWLLREDVEFPGGPPRVPGGPRDLYIRESHSLRRNIPVENSEPHRPNPRVPQLTSPQHKAPPSSPP